MVTPRLSDDKRESDKRWGESPARSASFNYNYISHLSVYGYWDHDYRWSLDLFGDLILRSTFLHLPALLSA
jgi:hypothetical protein